MFLLAAFSISNQREGNSVEVRSFVIDTEFFNLSLISQIIRVGDEVSFLF